MRTRHFVQGLVIPGLAAALLAAFVVLYLSDRPTYFLVLNAINERPFHTPFLDTRFVTAQVECWQRGIDVYAQNPCDPLGRTQDYSPLWLRMHALGRGDGWTPVFGLATDLLFVGSLFLIPWRRESAVVAVLAVVSWATVFGLERGNTDLLIFAACVLFAHLRVRSAAARCVGYALVLGVGLLKFYPLTLLVLAVRESARRFAIITGLCGAVLLVFFVVFHAELARIGANMTNGCFGDMFGARTLPVGLAAMWRALCQAHGWEPGPASMLLASGSVFAVLAAGCAAGAVAIARSGALRDMLVQVEPVPRSLLLVGAVLCVGCFFGHQNISYRTVMLLLVVPGLLELTRAAPPGPLRRVFRVTCVLVVLALWGAAMVGTLAGWLAVQLAWWWIVGVLMAVAVLLAVEEGQGLCPWTPLRAVALKTPL